jgi:hypothetical protein
MAKIAKNVLCFGLGVLGGFLIPLIWHKNGSNSDLEQKVVEVIKRDTIIVPKPIKIESRITDTIKIPVRDTMVVRDTLFLPREQVEYRDSLYRAVVSGFAPRLDCIEVYPVTRYVTITRTERKGSKFGIGFQVGVGAGAKGFSPYVGIGVQYNLWSF